MAQAKVKHVARPNQKTEAPAQTPPKKGTKTEQALLDEIDIMLDEIDQVLEEVAGGETSEYAQEFVKNYIQKGGE